MIRAARAVVVGLLLPLVVSCGRDVPEATVVSQGAPRVDTSTSTAPRLNDVASGQWGHVSWVLRRQIGDAEICHSWELKPPPNSSPGSGADTSCSPEPDLFDEGDPVQLIFADRGDYSVTAVALAREVNGLAIEPPDGRTYEVAIPDSRVVVLFDRDVERLHAKTRDGRVTCDVGSDEGFVTGLTCSFV